jgi:hypothetical protein
MTKDRGLRRFRPHLETLEARDLPSTLHVVGPNPNDQGAKGPFLNLIVVQDPSPDAGPGGSPVHRARRHGRPAHPPGPPPQLRRGPGPGHVILPFRRPHGPPAARLWAVANPPRLQP